MAADLEREDSSNENMRAAAVKRMCLPPNLALSLSVFTTPAEADVGSAHHDAVPTATHTYNNTCCLMQHSSASRPRLVRLRPYSKCVRVGEPLGGPNGHTFVVRVELLHGGVLSKQLVA